MILIVFQDDKTLPRRASSAVANAGQGRRRFQKALLALLGPADFGDVVVLGEGVQVPVEVLGNRDALSPEPGRKPGMMA